MTGLRDGLDRFHQNVERRAFLHHAERPAFDGLPYNRPVLVAAENQNARNGARLFELGDHLQSACARTNRVEDE